MSIHLLFYICNGYFIRTNSILLKFRHKILASSYLLPREELAHALAHVEGFIARSVAGSGRLPVRVCWLLGFHALYCTCFFWCAWMWAMPKQAQARA